MIYPANWLVVFLVTGLLAFYLSFLLWAYRSGQIRHAEDAKYAVFRDEIEEFGVGGSELGVGLPNSELAEERDVLGG
jgi:hypothetical protein